MLFNNKFIHYSFLYARGEHLNNSFRMIINLKEAVSYEALRKATDTAIIRYPYFSVRVVKCENGYDVVKNDEPFVISNTSEPPFLGTKSSNYHFVSVNYENNSIFIDCYHSLTDGAGITPFAKTLLYYYLCEKTGETIDPADINMVDDPIEEDEISDPTSRATNLPEKPFYVSKPEEPLSLEKFVSDTEGEQTTYYIKIDEKNFMDYAKSNDGTPNAIITAMFYKAILRNHPSINETITAGVAMTTRPAMDAEKSYANQVALLNLKYIPKMRDFDILKLATLGRGMIMLQSDPENVLYGLRERKKLIDYLDSLPNDEARQQAYYGMIQRIKSLDTFFESYTGKKNWGAVEPYIDSIYAISETAPFSFGVNIYAINGTFGITVNQSFGSDKYVKSFMEILTEENIRFSYEGKNETKVAKVKVY